MRDQKPVTRSTANFFAQARAAEKEQARFYEALRQNGWLWNEAGFYHHPHRPMEQIWPG